MFRQYTKEKNRSERNPDVLSHKVDSLYSDLLVNFQDCPKTGDECTSESDDPFEDILSCKNITFSRSTSYINTEFQWPPSTPLGSNQSEKENAYSTPRSDSRKLVKEMISQSSSKVVRSHQLNRKNNLRSPLKSNNSLMAIHTFNEDSIMPNTNEKSTPRVSRGDLTSFRLLSSIKKSSLNHSKLDGSFQQDDKSDLSCISPQTPISVTGRLDSNHKNTILVTPLWTPSTLPQNYCTPKNTTRHTSPHMSSFKKSSLIKTTITGTAKKDCDNNVKVARTKSLSHSKGGQPSTNFSSPLLKNNAPGQCDQCDCRCTTDSLCRPKSKLKNKSELPSAVYEISSCNKPKISRSSSNVGSLTPRNTELKKLERTPKGRQSLLTTSIVDCHNLNDGDAKKIPLATTGSEKCTALTTEQSINKGSSTNKDSESDSDDDLPCTQPASSIIFHGIVAYVEIRSGREYRNMGTTAELESLGAKVEKNFTKKVTHCFFHGGKMSTYRKAVEWKVPIVSILWIEACKAELQLVPIKGYEPHGIEKYKEALPLYKLKFKASRPATDSKVARKLWQLQNEKEKAPPNPKEAEPERRQLKRSRGEKNKLIDELHSVANGIRQASDKFQKILTSPILQKESKQDNCSKNDSPKESSEELFVTKKKRNKQLFACPGEGDSNKGEDIEPSINPTVDNSTLNNVTNDSISEIRVSYDSDDLLVYAKKQAASVRCSAPARLLTSRKCKKLVSSCQKSTEKEKDEESSKPSKQPGTAQDACELADPNSKLRTTRSKKSYVGRKSKIGNGLESSKKTKKRKLLPPLQNVTTFEQDSGESAPDLSPLCPYTESPHKKRKIATSSSNKTAKPLVPIPASSDWESDDSLTRAARRESSALFVKKERKVNLQRCIPTIVCTSLRRSDVETVTSVVSHLGKFAVEGTVSERTSHVVTSCPRRTINILKGIARGCWILNVQWVYQSLEIGKWLPEERYELIEFSPSVQQARVERQAFGPEFSLDLFVGVGPIYVCRTTVPPCNDLIELLRLCGGCVVSSARAARLVVGSSRPFSPVGQQRQPIMVKEKWVLDCVTRLSQLNPFEYIADDSEP